MIRNSDHMIRVVRVVDVAPLQRRLNALAYTHYPAQGHSVYAHTAFSCPPHSQSNIQPTFDNIFYTTTTHGQHTPDEGPLPHRLQAMSHRESLIPLTQLTYRIARRYVTSLFDFSIALLSASQLFRTTTVTGWF